MQAVEAAAAAAAIGEAIEKRVKFGPGVEHARREGGVGLCVELAGGGGGGLDGE